MQLFLPKLEVKSVGRLTLFTFFLMICHFVAISQTTIFSENMGTPSGTTSISSNIFQNSGILSYVGTGDVRTTSASSGYTGASGNGNVFITNTVNTYFTIYNINTSNYSSITMTFGLFKSGTGNLSSSNFIVEYATDYNSSSNTGTFTALSFTTITTGAAWSLVTVSGTIPSASSLAIRFRQNQTTQQCRVDDVMMKGTAAGLTPPALTAALGATVDAPFDVTFTDNSAWRGAIASVTVGGTTLTAGFTVSSGKITFTPSLSNPAGLLQTAGTNKSIAIIATGYNNATVSQTINAGVATKLSVTTEPAAPVSNGAALATQPVVAIQDQYGNTTTSTANVTAAVGAGTWTLGGTVTKAATAGSVSFTDLTATSAAAVTGATIAFTSGTLTSATSNGFNIPAPVVDYVSLTTIGVAVTEDFNSLATTGTSSSLPTGWTFFESGSNANSTYAAGTGSSTTGDTYSFGSSSSSDRALGSLQSGNLASTFGVKVKNNTGSAISEIVISYTGEQWRLGATSRLDKLDFQYSTNATSLSSGTYTDIDGLDFIAPVTAGTTGALDGNNAANRTTPIIYKITGLNITSGSTFWLRWVDYDAPSSADDGLGIDDISISVPNSQSIADYKTSSSGNFGTVANWLYKAYGTTYIAASQIPGNTNNVTVLHKITLDQDFTVGSGKTLTLDPSLISADTFNIAAGKTLTVTGSADFNGKQVTLKSNSTGTGSIGTSTGTISNATSVTVERYIPVNTTSGRTGKAWRLLTVPVTGSTIKNGWQEGSLWDGTGSVESSGYGTLITGLQQGNSGTANGNGFDFWSAISNSTSSIRYHSGSGTGAWNTFSSINGRKFEDQAAGAYANQGFLLYVRGDRSVSTGTANATVLRATGTLRQGTQSIPVLASGTSTYTLIGNPYASPINFESVYSGNSSLIQPRFTVWDANLGTTGGYVLVQRVDATHYNVTPSGGSTSSSTTAQYIQSGQAFFVEAKTTGGNLSIQESYKATGGTDGVFLKSAGTEETTASATAATIPSISVNLSIRNTDGTVLLADGALASFDKSYKRAVNGEDVKKASNFAENLSIAVDTFNLISESRPLLTKDTVFLRMWNTGVKDYRLTIKTSAFDGLGKTVLLKDKYLGTSRAIKTDGTNTIYNFSVTSDSGSKAADRFYIVFRPVTTTAATNLVADNSIRIYPNPVKNGRFTLSLDALIKGRYQISIFDNTGQQLMTRSIEHAGGALNERMVLLNQRNGIYNIRLSDASGKVVKTGQLIINK